MNIVTPTVEICKETGLKKIELIGKVCTKKEHTITETSHVKFVKDRIRDGHTAILLHEYVYFDVSEVDKATIRNLIFYNRYIHVDNTSSYIAMNYRTLLDMVLHSNRNNRRMNIIGDSFDDVVNLIKLFWEQATEFTKLFGYYDGVISLFRLSSNNYNDEDVIRVLPETILKYSPEIYCVTIKFVTDRGIGNEIVRHGEISPMQESTRWCNYSKDGNGVNFINPFDEPSVIDACSKANPCAEDDMTDSFASSECDYLTQIKLGVPAQIARNVLSLGLKTEMFMTGNLEMWFGENIDEMIGDIYLCEKKGFLPQRTAKQAHPQLRPLANQVKELLINEYGEYYDGKSKV